jgi:hypothetical protein
VSEIEKMIKNQKTTYNFIDWENQCDTKQLARECFYFFIKKGELNIIDFLKLRERAIINYKNNNNTAKLKRVKKAKTEVPISDKILKLSMEELRNQLQYWYDYAEAYKHEQNALLLKLEELGYKGNMETAVCDICEEFYERIE